MGDVFIRNDVNEQTYPDDDTPITLNKVTTYEDGEREGAEDFGFDKKYFLAYKISKIQKNKFQNITVKSTPLVPLPTYFQMTPPSNFDVESFNIRLKKKNDFNFSVVLRDVIYSSPYFNGKKKLNCIFIVEYYDTATSSNRIGFNDSREMNIPSTKNVDLQQTNFWDVTIPSDIVGNKYMDIYVHIYGDDVNDPYITQKTARIPLLVTVDLDFEILRTGIDIYTAHQYKVSSRTKYNNPYYEKCHLYVKRNVNWYQTSTSTGVINRNTSDSLLNISYFTDDNVVWTNYLPSENVRGLYYEIIIEIRDVLKSGGWPQANDPLRNPIIRKSSQRFRHLG